MRCVNNVDEEEHAITATDLAAEVGALERFVRRCAAPLIPELTRRNEVEYSRVSVCLLLLLLLPYPPFNSPSSLLLLLLLKPSPEFIQFHSIPQTKEKEEKEGIKIKATPPPPAPQKKENNHLHKNQKPKKKRQTGKSLLHYFFTTQPEKDSYRKEMRPLAKKYAEFLHFTLNDANEYPEMVTFMGLEAGSKTGLSLQNPNTGDVFPYRQKTKKRITPAMVERFLEDVIDGKVRPLGGRKDGGRDEL